MKTSRTTGPSTEALERAVLQSARGSLPLGSSGVESNLRAVHQRILALPLTGLPDIDFPDIPSALPGDLGALPPSAGMESVGLTQVTHGSGALPVATTAHGLSAATTAATTLPMIPWLSGATVKALVFGAAVVAGGALTVPYVFEGQPGNSDAQRGAPSTTRGHSQRVSRAAASGGPLVSEGPRKPAPNAMHSPAYERPPSGSALRGTAAVGTSREGLKSSPEHPVVSGSNARESTVTLEPPNFLPDRKELSPKASVSSELLMLQEAQRLLKVGDAAGSLRQLRVLRNNSAGGSLLPERQVTEVLALCVLGRSAEARAIARQLEGTDSYNVYRPRLETSCVPKGRDSR